MLPSGRSPLPIFLALRIYRGEDKTDALRHFRKLPLSTCLFEIYCWWNTVKRSVHLKMKGKCQETKQPWPSALHRQWYSSQRNLLFSFALSMSSFSSFFIHKYCRWRAALMPLPLVINHDSGPNKLVHLNTEKPTVQHSLHLFNEYLKVPLHHLYLFYIFLFYL